MMENEKKILRQAREDLAHCEKAIARIRTEQLERWRSMAGDAFPAILESRNHAESFLVHHDPRVRCVAMSVLSHIWRPDAKLASECEKLFYTDSDSDVREVALSVLGQCYRGTNDARLGKAMAEIAMNKLLPMSLRQLAYINLFELRGLSPEHWPMHEDFGQANIDKDFIRSFF